MPLLTSSQRMNRLKSEYEAICKFPFTNLMQVALSPGQTPPYVTSYSITYNNKTYIRNSFGEVIPQRRTVIRVDIPDSFPFNCPSAYIIEGDCPWHPNWYTSGRMCTGTIWHTDMWVWDFILKLGRVLAFDPALSDPTSPANSTALDFWRTHLKSFPCGRVDFPHPRGY